MHLTCLLPPCSSAPLPPAPLLLRSPAPRICHRQPPQGAKIRIAAASSLRHNGRRGSHPLKLIFSILWGFLLQVNKLMRFSRGEAAAKSSPFYGTTLIRRCLALFAEGSGNREGRPCVPMEMIARLPDPYRTLDYFVKML